MDSRPEKLHENINAKKINLYKYLSIYINGPIL